MKHIILLITLFIFSLSAYSQKSGEKNIGNKLYSHSPNKHGEIKNLTVKWEFRSLLGEPVLNGSFKWEAGNKTPNDFLDYRDAIVLHLEVEFQRKIHYNGRYLYIKLSPLVPKAGEGYGFNVSGSPNWSDLFCDYEGNSLNLSERDAKDIWKWGFKITTAHLIREGGLDKDEPAKSSSSKNDFWNTPENTTTQNDLKQNEAIERQKKLTQQAKDKYNALNKPLTLSVTNRDTVSEVSLRPLKAINPYFQNGILTLISVSNGKVISKANTVNAYLQLAEGWNILRIALKGDNYNFKDSVRVYYKKRSIKNDLDGIWDRGDIEIVIKNESAVFSKIKTGDWVNYLNHGSISVGSLKLKNISKVSANEWICNDLWKMDNKTFWNSATLKLNTEGNTLIVESQNSNGKVIRNLYSRK